MSEDLAPWVALSLIVGGKTIDRLLAHFGTLTAVLDARESDLRAVPRIGPKLAATIRAVDLDRTRTDIQSWQAAGIEILRRHDPGYPALLRACEDAPPVLFRRGRPNPDQTVAIVGTRDPSPDGLQYARDAAAHLVECGWWIASGMALGIDTAAHRSALDAGGNTIGVLGNGVRTVYPPENAALFSRVLALLSETHPTSPPTSPALVARNRITSGISRAVIIVEAGPTSGSLHAARFARQQGRLVYAIANSYEGNQQLIADGAVPLDPGMGGRDFGLDVNFS
jgi:DNA processing protein